MNLSTSDWNFIICTLNMVIIAIVLTITLNKISESNKSYFQDTKK